MNAGLAAWVSAGVSLLFTAIGVLDAQLAMSVLPYYLGSSVTAITLYYLFRHWEKP